MPPTHSTTDPRFASLHTDPRFVRPKAAKNKIVVDERFKEFFDDPSDQSISIRKNKRASVDKYGRALTKDAKSNELKRYYRMASPVLDGEENEGDKDKGKNHKRKDKKAQGQRLQHNSKDNNETEPRDSAGEENDRGTTSFLDLARGEGLVESSDEDESAESDLKIAKISGETDDTEEETGESGSESNRSVTLAPTRLRRRHDSRSPSIDLSETEAGPFGKNDSHNAGVLDQSDEEEGAEATTRLAVVNMDWDHLRASDLFRVLASSLSATAKAPIPAPQPKSISKKFDSNGDEIGPYKPSSKLNIAPGRLLHLRTYPSKFGLERMDQEAREGPPTELFRSTISDGDESDVGALRLGRKKGKGRSSRKNVDQDEGSDADEPTERDIVNEQLEEGGEDYDGEALRRYQLERLRYYYAVATFDTVQAAAHVFSEINGTEFERTANVFDLQYVPEATSFEGDPVHDEATESSVAAMGPNYQGVEFVTDALRHSKVKLTWDADDPHRKSKITNFLASASDVKGKGRKQELNEDDLRVYLASASEDEDEVTEVKDEEEGNFKEEQDDFFDHSEVISSHKKADTKRERLRNLFGLDSLRTKDWDGGKGASKRGAEGGMEITFTPALSGAISTSTTKSKDGDQEETAIEIYKRKEKERRERKRVERQAKREGKPLSLPDEREGPEFNGTDTGPGGFDDDFFADDVDVDKALAAFDAGEDLSDSGRAKSKTNGNTKTEKLSKKAYKAAKEAEEAENLKSRAELELLVASDSDGDSTGLTNGRHFDMRAIIKSEKNMGKKKRTGKGKAKRDNEDVLKDNFVIDTADDRFKSLHEDYDFAIDPTNPRFQKTKNMQLLLSEGRDRRSKHQGARAPVTSADVKGNGNSFKSKSSEFPLEGDSLQKLVESVKRKAGEVGGRGKRSKA